MRKSNVNHGGMISYRSKEEESESPNVKNEEDKASLTGVNENKVISVSRVI